jgi:alkylhydroperoxidase/carboxymuconolactone decarboxylase family protein YurZ
MTHDADTFLETGLDFADETFSPEEKASVLAWYRDIHDYGDLDLAPFARFLVEHDPVGFKALRRHVESFQPRGREIALPVAAGVLMYVYFYVAAGNGKGALYEIIAARALGCSRAEVLETIHLATLVAGPLGVNPLGELAHEYLLEWPEDESSVVWPEGWAPDPAAFRSGIDHSSDELTEAELELVRAWHRRLHGEVPRHVDFFAAADPVSFKTQQLRVEKAVGGALPAQLIPLLQLVLAAIRLWPQPVRRAVQEARSLGARREHAVATLYWAAVYGGDTVLETAFDAAGDLLESWD